MKKNKQRIIPVWTTKGGERIPADKLTDLHLDNIIAMLERRIEKLSYDMASCFAYAGGGEMAEYYALGEADTLSKKAAGVSNIVGLLKEERERRQKGENFLKDRKCDCGKPADIAYFETRYVKQKGKVVARIETFSHAHCQKCDTVYRRQTDPARFGLGKRKKKAGGTS